MNGHLIKILELLAKDLSPKEHNGRLTIWQVIQGAMIAIIILDHIGEC